MKNCFVKFTFILFSFLLLQKALLSQGLPPGWDYIPTPTTHIISIPLTSEPNINGYQLKAGDWIGVFYVNDSGNLSCGGAVEWTATQNTGIIGFGNDSFTPVKDGFSNNELINYKVYSWSVQRSYDAIVTCNNSLPSTCLNFIANGLSGLETLNSSGFYLVIEASSEDVCQGESVQLNAIPSGGSGNYSYSWTSAPEGFTSNIPNPSVTPQVTTIFSCEVTNGSSNITASITVNVDLPPTANAGNDLSVCYGQNAQLSGSSTNAQTFLWTTSGDGAFSNNSLLNTIYSPGTNDLENGSAELCLTTTGSLFCPAANDCLTLTINPLPNVTLAPFPTFCAGDPPITLTGGLPVGGVYFVNGTPTVTFNPSNPGTFNVVYSYTDSNGCSNSANGQILVKPLPVLTCPTEFVTCCNSNPIPLNIATPPGGTYSGQGVENNVFYPDCANIGVFPITYTYTSPTTGCQNTCSFSIIVTPLPVVTCPDEIEVCYNTAPFILTGATPLGGVYWGTGVSNNIFNPQVAGIGTHLINYIFTDENGCVNSCSFDVLVKPLPAVNAGFPQVFILLPNNIVYLNDASASNFDNILWTTSGSGIFNDSTIVNPEYYLSEEDILSGTVTLALSGYNECGMSSDSILVIINECQPAVIDAGSDTVICENQTLVINDAAAQFYETLIWSNNGGDGYFDDVGIINPVYTPGPTDIELGSVVLVLTAFPLEPCDTVSDQKILNIQKLPSAIAGTDIIICQSEAANLSGSAENYSFILWSTDGDGFFESPSSLSATYNPGITDITNGQVVLSLTAYAINPCAGNVSDDLSLTIVKNPSVNAGEDVTIAKGQDVQMNAAASNYFFILWSTSGDGIFSNYNILDPVYTPGVLDIQNTGATLTLSAHPNDPCLNIVEDDIVVTIDTVTTIKNLYHKPKIKIFPNPFSDLLKIEVSGFDKTAMEIMIFDQNGHSVFSQNDIEIYFEEHFIKSIDFRQFKNGLYLIKIRIGDFTFTEKVSFIR